MNRKQIASLLLGTIVLICMLSMVLAYWLLSRSLPHLAGQLAVAGIEHRVRIERDSLGIPSIKATTPTDAFFALGFVHAQERYFQMDILRRRAAGELAELLGDAFVDHDRRTRVHRFRTIATRAISNLPASDRIVLEAYTGGVNAGLSLLQSRPFEYYVLRTRPRAWSMEDSVLTLFALYLQLQAGSELFEITRSALHATLPEAMYRFLTAPGSDLDAPLAGETFETPALPGPEVFNLRTGSDPGVEHGNLCPPRLDYAHLDATGSNSWVISGAWTRHGDPMLANDLHLEHTLPNIWYRALLTWQQNPAAQLNREIVGATLPGLPGMVTGSNGRVAWGFTNTQGDWIDLVELELDPEDDQRYRTPSGWRTFTKSSETIKVKNAQALQVEILHTVWGPVVGGNDSGAPRAMRWVAHDVDQFSLRIDQLAAATSVQEILLTANASAGPHQNIVAADSDGNIGWSIFGPIPVRQGFDGQLPTSWADGSNAWRGYLPPESYPRIINPPEGMLWTANNRIVDGDGLRLIGTGAYDQGARAGQLRYRLKSLHNATEEDQLAIQLDDEVLALKRWQRLLIRVLRDSAETANPLLRDFLAAVTNWHGYATIESVGYRLVSDFRNRIVCGVLSPLIAPAAALDPRVNLHYVRPHDGPAWKIITERPLHLLEKRHPNWDQFLTSIIDEMLAAYLSSDVSIAEYTWGEINLVNFRHPLGEINWVLGQLLNLPAAALPGGWTDVPRIQSPTSGASQRMVVTPGREQRGIFHMPGGQSGNPLSPHYQDGHAAWFHGHPTPLLPSAPVSVLELVPLKQ